MHTLRRLCVYCGSKPGHRPAYAEAAHALGTLLADQGVGLVYGGASIGLMGVVADAVLDGGGEVLGVIPHGIAAKEVAHPDVTELFLVGSMHERKALMADLADGFLALPGGLGTLEEIAEALTWAQLGIHAKPCGLLNVAGYFDGLVAYLDHAEAEGLLRPEHRALVLVEPSPERILGRLRAHRPPAMPRWISRDET
ncbi:MAG: TIGR00730 family Rossman fold protein [Rubricoccaceae bacterium]|nr:TIGR00730 family Rossman fold protein [Rubricoccaceae bacterium]